MKVKSGVRYNEEWDDKRGRVGEAQAESVKDQAGGGPYDVVDGTELSDSDPLCS